MSDSTEFSQALLAWSETVMRQSLHDMVHYSKSNGLTMPQLSTLYHLHQDDECGVSHVGEHLGVTNAAASQMIDRLVQQGYIERTEDPNDRRVKQLKLTTNGAAIVQEGIQVRRRWMVQLSEVLTVEEQESIIEALNLLTSTVLSLESSQTKHFQVT
jgi:DNA-binding MarR family transcriptional regulator